MAVSFYLGGEAGYKVKLTRTILHPYLSLGFFKSRVEDSDSETKSHFYVTPAMSFSLMVNEQMMIGPDIRYTILTSQSTQLAKSSLGIFLSVEFIFIKSKVVGCRFGYRSFGRIVTHYALLVKFFPFDWLLF